MSQQPFKPPTAEQIDRLLVFLPIFQRPDLVAATSVAGLAQMPASLMNSDQEWCPELATFHRAVYDEGFVFSFDWGEWQEQAGRYVNEPDTLQEADLTDICRLLTTHVRKERFCEGHLAAMVTSGHITRVLQRLQRIRETVGITGQMP